MAGAVTEKEARLMEQFVNAARCCPECSSKQYVFRGRKKITAATDQPAAVETKRMCKECGHAWKERVTMKAG
jgi:DNA-directed RNA polymerase subunit M/transcription elongation factor TFIIS